AGGLGNGLLWRSDGSSLVELFAPLLGASSQLAYENSASNRATMNGDGTRFLFTTPDLNAAQNGFAQLAIAEINPINLGAAPAMTSPAIDPPSIPSDGKGYSVIISANVSSAT